MVTRTAKLTKTKPVATGNVTAQSKSSPKTALSAVVGRVREVVQKAAEKILDESAEPVSLVQSRSQITLAYLLLSNDSSHSGPRADQFKQSSRKFSAVESLTGIASERPEIVLLMNFLPLFSEANLASPTAAAKYFDVQSQVRELRSENVKRVGFEAKDDLKELFAQQRIDFKSAVSDLYKHALFLLVLVREAGRLDSQLDMRHNSHVVDANAVLELVRSGYSNKSLATISGDVNRDLLLGMNRKFSTTDTLAQFGFSPSNVANFSSTKIWLQLLLELKHCLTTHSPLLLDASLGPYINDRDPVTLVKPQLQRFTVNTAVQIFSIDEMINVDASQLPTAIASIDLAYRNIYSGITFKSDEQRISALCSEASREFRYSAALSEPAVQSRLRQSYSYTAAVSGNQRMFDRIVGQFGNTVADVAADRGKSLADLSIRVDGDEAVLTFESRYVPGPNGVLKPGSVHYVDRVLQGLKLDSSMLQGLLVEFDAALKSFLTLADDLNLFMLERGDNTLRSLVEPRKFFEFLSQNFVDLTAGRTKNDINQDKLAFVYALAMGSSSTAKKLKSMLFLHSMLNVFSSDVLGTTPFNGALVPELLTSIVRAVNELTSLTAVPPPGVFTISEIDLRKAFDANDSNSFFFVQYSMSLVHGSFKRNGLCIVNGKLRYGGYADTLLMMMVFDLLLSIVGKFSSQTIAGKFLHGGNTFYAVLRLEKSVSTSLSDVIGRLDRESMLLKRFVLSMTNTLKNISDASRSFIDHLNNPSTRAEAADIARIIDDDVLIDALVDEQQIMLVAGSIIDLQQRLSELTNISTTKSFSVDGDDDFDDADMFTLLDDGVIDQKLRDAVFGAFSGAKYTSFLGGNKRILSVGVPIGFSHALKRVSAVGASAFSDKQSDVINVCVHRVDLLHQDIVYLPVKFIFELSRFPVRASRQHPMFKGFDDYVRSFPTRDFKRSLDGQSAAAVVEYLRPAIGQVQAFSDSSYSFMSNDQRLETIRNHVLSFLLEVYMSVLTGISTAEHDMSMIPIEKLIDDDHLEQLIVSNVAHARDKGSTQPSAQGVFFAGSGLLSPKRKKKAAALSPASKVTIAAALGGLSDRVLPVVDRQLVTIDDFSRMVSPMVARAKLLRRGLSPRIFERVLNVVIDPDEFFVDRVATVATPAGKESLERLLSSGDALEDERGNVIMRSRSIDEFALEKYFVTIETVEAPVRSIFQPGFLSPKRRRT